MKSLFYIGTVLWILFEIANVYFIMPMPGSQEMESISIAYILYSWRWILRCLFALMILAGIRHVWKRKYEKWLSIIILLILLAVIAMTNFKMAADRMFLQPHDLIMKNARDNKVEPDRLVLGIVHNGEARAYPIQFIGYHHQVQDSIGDKPVIVTYCTVCRTGRVFEPIVNGEHEHFRLVGMDHFNAMFEDSKTKSWWRQENGEAVAGKLKGQYLNEWPSTQTTLERWLKLHPFSLIMQPDPAFADVYSDMDEYERGRREGTLTVYDTASWNDKSWIAGIAIGDESKAYDWNVVKEKHIIHDNISGTPVLLFATDDDRSLFAFVRETSAQQFELRNDTLYNGNLKFDLQGHSYQQGVDDLDRITAYQEYWHSWRTFHPATKRYPE